MSAKGVRGASQLKLNIPDSRCSRRQDKKAPATLEIDRFENTLKSYENSQNFSDQTRQSYETVETTKHVPIQCHIKVPKTRCHTTERIKRIESDVPLIIEKPTDSFPQTYFDDKIIEVPSPVTVLKPCYKQEIREFIKEVPKTIEKVVDKVIEIPEIQYINKYKEIPEVEYHVKYIPKSRPNKKEHYMYTPDLSTPQRVEYKEVSDRMSPKEKPQKNQEVPGGRQFIEENSQKTTFLPPYPDFFHFPAERSCCSPPRRPIIDIDVPYPVPIPVVCDYPLDIPLERPIPTPVVVSQRIHPVYKEEGEVNVEVYVPNYVRSPTPPYLQTRRGDQRVIGYKALEHHDDYRHYYYQPSINHAFLPSSYGFDQSSRSFSPFK